MLVSVEAFRTCDRMPEPHQLVIVAGGVAVWTGSVWLSKIDDNRVIEWPVEWWMPIINALSEFPDPRIQPRRTPDFERSLGHRGSAR